MWTTIFNSAKLLIIPHQTDAFVSAQSEGVAVWEPLLVAFHQQKKRFWSNPQKNFNQRIFYLTYYSFSCKYEKLCVCLFLSIAGIAVYGQPGSALLSKLDQQAKEIQPKVIQWRREFHEHPELSNQEFKTGKLIAEFLKSLGLKFNILLPERVSWQFWKVQSQDLSLPCVRTWMPCRWTKEILCHSHQRKSNTQWCWNRSDARVWSW